jgi:hypothetical protein
VKLDLALDLCVFGVDPGSDGSDSLVPHPPADGRGSWRSARGGQIEVDDARSVEHAIVVDESPHRPGAFDLEVSREVTHVPAQHAPLGIAELPANLESPKQIARREGMARRALGEGHAELAGLPLPRLHAQVIS